MIDCPECMESIKGMKCGCGYVVPRAISFPGDRFTRSETALTESSRQWLEANGIHQHGMTRAEKTRANLAYIKSLKTKPKPNHYAWAHRILDDVADGVCVNSYAAACAKEVVGALRTKEKVAA